MSTSRNRCKLYDKALNKSQSRTLTGRSRKNLSSTDRYRNDKGKKYKTHDYVNLNLKEKAYIATARMYYDGVRNIRTREKNAKDQKLQKEKLETKDLRFKPSINAFSELIVGAKKIRNDSVENRLLSYGKVAIEKKDIIRNIKREVEINDCTFTPKIDKFSQLIDNYNKVTNKSIDTNNYSQRYEQLYELSKTSKYVKDHSTTKKDPNFNSNDFSNTKRNSIPLSDNAQDLLNKPF